MDCWANRENAGDGVGGARPPQQTRSAQCTHHALPPGLPHFLPSRPTVPASHPPPPEKPSFPLTRLLLGILGTVQENFWRAAPPVDASRHRLSEALAVGGRVKGLNFHFTFK